MIENCRLFQMWFGVIVKDPFAEEQPADDQLLIPNDGCVNCHISHYYASCWFLL